jgi:hypothetical protein
MKYAKLRIMWSVGVILFAVFLPPLIEPGRSGSGPPPVLTDRQWLLVFILSLAVAAAAWISARYELRSLLIAMTVIALALGLLIHVAKQ